MDISWEGVEAWLRSEAVFNWVEAALLVLGGLVLARVVAGAASRLAMRQVDLHRATLLRRVVYYLVLGLFIASALSAVGFDLGVLLGAAGILTVAIGFASQTSASNVISGLFLFTERAFSLGDVIRVGETTGEVLSIDLLSAKLRTFDNLFVRVPNETLIKSQIVNLSRFPIRRLDLQIGVAYKEEIPRVRELLMEAADQNPLCLQEPTPLFMFLGYGESALNLQFSVWAKRENFLELRNRMLTDIKAAFDTHGVEIPFPHRTLYVGSITDPMPVRMVPDPPAGGAAAASGSPAHPA